MTTTQLRLAADNKPGVPPQSYERRADCRLMTTLRVGKITCQGEQELCLIRNISEGGLMLRVYSDRAIGEQVSIELKSDHSVSGIVTWVEDDLIGVRFDALVDVSGILTNAPSPDGRRPRAPRIDAHDRAKLRIGRDSWQVELRDLSQRGAKIRVQDALSIGDDGVLTINGLQPIKAVVRWQMGDQAGLEFLPGVSIGDLVAWLGARRRYDLERAGRA